MARRTRTSCAHLFIAVPLAFACGIIPAVSEAPSDGAGHEVRGSLGPAVLPLYGPWKFMIGDSPADPSTRQPLWAQPGLDDSAWETVDLTPAKDAYEPVGGYTGYVPGWSARGHAGYAGFAWYRMQVHLSAPPTGNLALMGPSVVDDAYQVFVDGRLLGSFGDFTANHPPVIYSSQARMFPVSQTSLAKSDSPTLLVVFRVWKQRGEIVPDPETGGLRAAPLLGDAGVIAAEIQLQKLDAFRSASAYVLGTFLFAIASIVAFSLLLFDRSDRVYSWMGAVFLLMCLLNLLVADSFTNQHQSILTNRILTDCILAPLIFGGWVIIWWLWFGLRRPAGLPRAVVLISLLLMISYRIGDVSLPSITQPVAAAFHYVSLALRLILFALILWIVLQGIRRQGLEGWLVLPVIPLEGLGMFWPELSSLNVPVFWYPFGLTIFLGQLSSLILLAAMALLMLRRLLLSIRRQRLMALDVKQAQEVQQVILPELRTELPGLTIECQYRPAREVGGDFFQIIPHKSDRSLLIVAGDVTGKGLKAGMLVALLVGAVRSTAELDSEPMSVLHVLNRRLMGRADAQATCLALRIAINGAVTLANAGHLPPYLNGDPLPMEGALPLGMIEEPEFSVMQFHLQPGDKLVLISDGIAEATDAEGHLFGFERVHGLLRTGTGAAELADVAQTFGQEDDISVIFISRNAVQDPSIV
ncbi:MAG: PP2C family protein-serine/threonine phosphatase [Terracidiphilus sp.]